MPPKNPKDKNKDKNKQPETQADPTVDLKALQSVTTLLAQAKSLRNRFQLERDKIHKFWEITKKELENAKFELQNADHELEEMESRHQVEMKVYKQKVRHLLYEHKMQLQDIRTQSDLEIQEATKEHQRAMAQYKETKATLHRDYEAAFVSHEDEVNEKRRLHHNMVTSVKKRKFEENFQKRQEEYEEKLAVLREELELRRRAEIHEIEERKNEHINELIRKHEEAFKEMKKYYNQITSNNLELIKSLKEEIAAMRRNDEHNKDLMNDIGRENDNLNVPLDKAKAEVRERQIKLHNYEKDKLSLRNARSRLRALDEQFTQLQEDHKSLQQKYGAVQADKEALQRKFESALHDASDVAQERNVALQQKLLEVNAAVEARDAQLSSVLAAVNLEPATLEVVTRKLEDVLETKNRAIKDLHFELKKIQKQHREVMGEYERRCVKAKLPSLEVSEL